MRDEPAPGRDAGPGRGDRRTLRRTRRRPPDGHPGRSGRGRPQTGGFAVVTRRRAPAERPPGRLQPAARPRRRPARTRARRAPRPSTSDARAPPGVRFTGYLAIDRRAVADDSPLFHQVLQDYDRPIHDGNNVLVSLSPAGGPGLRPADVRVATMSTHTRPGDWSGLDRDGYAARKAEYRGRLLAALARALPDAPDASGPRRVRHPSELRALHPADRRGPSAAPRSRGRTARSSPSAPTSSGRASGSSATRSSPARGRWPPSSRPSGSSSGSRERRWDEMRSSVRGTPRRSSRRGPVDRRDDAGAVGE